MIEGQESELRLVCGSIERQNLKKSKRNMANPNMNAMDVKDTLLHQSWQNEAWMPILNPSNVLEYFAESIFYDPQCNNGIIRMQRLNPDQMLNMVGPEYVLLISQEPILYVIRKQHRTSPTQVIPLAHYYVIAGKVYQAPDLGSIVNSRLSNCANYLQQAFSETHSYAKYQSAKGYYWEFKDKESQALEVAKEEKLKGEHLKRKTSKKKEEPSSVFQRQKVDRLLDDITKKFPLKLANQTSTASASSNNANTENHPHHGANAETTSGVASSAGTGVTNGENVVAETDAATSAEPEALSLPNVSSTTTSVSIGSGAKRVAHADVKSAKSEAGDASKPPLEKKIKLEKK